MIHFRNQNKDVILDVNTDSKLFQFNTWFYVSASNDKCYVNGERHYVGMTPINTWPDWMARQLGVR